MKRLEARGNLPQGAIRGPVETSRHAALAGHPSLLQSAPPPGSAGAEMANDDNPIRNSPFAANSLFG